MTNCNRQSLSFPPCRGRSIAANLDGGEILSDGEALLLRETDRRVKLRRAIARGLADPRHQASCEHGLLSRIRQRIYALALGYADPGPKFLRFFTRRCRHARRQKRSARLRFTQSRILAYRTAAIRSGTLTTFLPLPPALLRAQDRARPGASSGARSRAAASLVPRPGGAACSVSTPPRVQRLLRDLVLSEPSPPPRGRMTLERH